MNFAVYIRDLCKVVDFSPIQILEAMRRLDVFRTHSVLPGHERALQTESLNEKTMPVSPVQV